MLVFDKDRKRCVAPPTAECDIPVTTPQPDEEQNNSGGRRVNNNGNRGGNPENRRRFQSQAAAGPSGARPNQAPQGLPFNLPEGAQILARPPQQ